MFPQTQQSSESNLTRVFEHHKIQNWKVEDDQLLKKVFVWIEGKPSEALMADFEKLVYAPWLIEFRELKELES